MKIHLSELWRLDGTIDRRPYFVLGVSLSLLKMYFDYLIATRLFGRTWTPFDAHLSAAPGMHGATRRISISTVQACAGDSGTSNELSNSIYSPCHGRACPGHPVHQRNAVPTQSGRPADRRAKRRRSSNGYGRA